MLQYIMATTYSFLISEGKQIDNDSLSDEISSSEITIALDSIVRVDATLDITFKASLSNGEELILNDIVDDHTGIPIQQPIQVTLTNKTDSDGRLVVASEKSASDGLTVWSHDFGNPQTWYQGASLETVNTTVTVLNKIELNVPHSVNTSQNAVVVSTVGLIQDEDSITTGNVNRPTFDILVTIGGTTYVVGTPLNGVLISVENTIGSTLVLGISGASLELSSASVSFWKAGSSRFLVVPDQGYELHMQNVNLLLDDDISMSGWFQYSVEYFNGSSWVMVPNSNTIFKSKKAFFRDCRRIIVVQDKLLLAWEYYFERVIPYGCRMVIENLNDIATTGSAEATIWFHKKVT